MFAGYARALGCLGSVASGVQQGNIHMMFIHDVEGSVLEYGRLLYAV